MQKIAVAQCGQLLFFIFDGGLLLDILDNLATLKI